MNFIISYDISLDKKRKKASNLLEEFGVRIQYSVFQCELNKKELSRLKDKLNEIINSKTDSVYFFPSCENCMNKRIMIGSEFSIRKINVLTID
jgi:CRISPR-associated protein Cas2